MKKCLVALIAAVMLPLTIATPMASAADFAAAANARIGWPDVPGGPTNPW